LWSTHGTKEIAPLKAEAEVKAKGRKISFQTLNLTLNLNLLLLLEVLSNESAWEEISL
jgi:hypothetical protein